MTHALIPCALVICASRGRVSGRLVFWCCVASILPDLDVVAFKLGIAYSDPLGHRGFTHSLAFALALGVLGSVFHRYLRASRMAVFTLVTLSCASHALLDALTNGGLGVAFWWPFDSARYFLPWQPIAVSPIGISGFISQRGLQVLASEAQIVWLPLALVFGSFLAARAFWRRRLAGGGSSAVRGG